LLRIRDRQQGWRGRLPFWLSVIRRPALPSRLHGGRDVAQRQPRSRLSRPGHVVKLAEQVTRGPPRGAWR
jgi:hypothetical protein